MVADKPLYAEEKEKEVPMAEDIRQLQVTIQELLERIDVAETNIRSMKNRLWGE